MSSSSTLSLQQEYERRPLAKGSACERCKARKVRCGAEKPACMNCLKHARRCEYPQSKVHSYDLSSSSPLGPQRERDHSDIRYAPYPQSYGNAQPQTLPQPQPQSPMQSFQPYVGVESDQQLPAHWEDLDFSWLLDLRPGQGESSGDIFDAAMQEHCYWLYFTNQRASGLEMNIGRFYERLLSPDPSDRPHPAMLNAIYLVTCKASPIDFVRGRAHHFFAEADSALNDAIREITVLNDKILDLLRAAILLTQWLWGQAREGEAILMTAKACRLAIGAGYDQITSSNTLSQRRPPPLIRARRPMCPPPKDYVELAERIFAFWSVVMLSLSAAIASAMPAHIDPLTIRTPLPKAWSDYTEDDPTPDSYLADLFVSNNDNPPWTDFACIIQSTVLLHLAALKSMSVYDGPHTTITLGSTAPLEEPLSGVSPATPSTSFSTTTLTNDRSGSLSMAVERFVTLLPDHLKAMDIGGDDEAPRFSPQSATMHFMVSATRMYLVDTNSLDQPNDAALYHVRRIVDLIRVLSPEDIVCLSLFVYVVWVLAAQLLMRESKRLRLQGEIFAAMALEADLAFLGSVLAQMSQHSRLISTELRDLHSIIDLPMEEMFRAGMRAAGSRNQVDNGL